MPLCLIAATLLILGSACTHSTKDEVDALVTSAEFSLAADDKEASIVLYEMAYELDPSNEYIRGRLATVLFDQARHLVTIGELSLAEHRLARAEALGKGLLSEEQVLRTKLELEALTGADPTQVLALERDLYAAQPSVELALRIADKLDASGQIDDALYYYREALAQGGIAGVPPATKLRVAQLLEEEGDWEGAKPIYEDHLASNPDDRAARLGLARHAEFAGDFGSAEKVYREYAEATPDRAGEWRRLLAFYKRTENQAGIAEVQGVLTSLRKKPKKKRPLR